MITVGALDTTVVARLGAFAADVSFLVAVATLDDTRLLTVLRLVAFLTTVAASEATASTLRAVLGEVTHLVTLLALDTLGTARLGALLGGVTLLLAVAASTLQARLRAVTLTVAELVAVVARDLDLVSTLNLLLGALLGTVTKRIAVGALLDAAINSHAGVAKAFKVLGVGGRPDSTLDGAARELREAELDGELAVQVALEVHVGPGRCQLLLNGDDVQGDVLVSEALLEFHESGGRKSLDVPVDGWDDVVQVAFLDGGDNLSPGSLGKDGLDIGAVELARLGASEGDVTFFLAVAADLGGSVRTIGSTVTGLLADSAGTSKLTNQVGVGRVGAIGLVVTLCTGELAQVHVSRDD